MTTRTKERESVPDAEETRADEIGEFIRFTSVHYDQDSENPLKAWSAMGEILSLGRRHAVFAPDRVNEELADNPDAVPLGYYEHGQSCWFVAGEAPPGADCPWDGVPVAGVWVPDAEGLKEAPPAGPERVEYMRARARAACDAYTAYCNGQVYGFSVRLYRTRLSEDGTDTYEELNDYRFEEPEFADACSGFYGSDDLERAVRDAMAAARAEADRNS